MFFPHSGHGSQVIIFLRFTGTATSSAVSRLSLNNLGINMLGKGRNVALIVPCALVSVNGC